HAHLFFTKDQAVSAPEDLNGKRMRVAGGKANLVRLENLGAQALVVPWPDLPEALTSGRVDGTLTTPMTVVSGSLWQSGIAQAYLDYQYFAQYVPLVSNRTWFRLPEDVRQIILETWEEGVDAGRQAMAVAQRDALQTMMDNGVVVVRPEQTQLDQVRMGLMPMQKALVSELGLDPKLVEAASEALP
ncbi:MAG: TRAP transporter substrate-binding protein DctP, partial [Rhodospirillaceae bacterium]